MSDPDLEVVVDWSGWRCLDDLGEVEHQWFGGRGSLEGGWGSRGWRRGLPELGEVVDELVLLDAEVVVEEVKQLLLHEVDLGEGEEPGVFLPVHVLWAGIVEVLCGADEDGEEDSVTSALHASRNCWELLL